MKFRHVKLSTAVVAGSIILLLLFGLAADMIGYRQFTDTIVNQYEETSLNIAQTAAEYVTADDIDEYISSEGKSEEFKNDHDVFQKLCDDMDAYFIYVILNDSEDFMQCTFAIEAVNTKTSEFGELPPGAVLDISDSSQDPYREAFSEMRNLNLNEKVVVISDSNSNTGKHIAAVKSIRDENGNIKGFLLVQQQISDISPVIQHFALLVLVFTLLLAILAGFGWYAYMRKRLLRPLETINREAHRFADENTLIESPLKGIIKYEDELAELAVSMEEMEKKTVAYFTEKERVESELQIATAIQANMLPTTFPAFPDRREFDLYASMDPAKEVGGDFYDFFLIDDTHLGVVMADVSGKGVPAALFMAKAKTMIRAYAQSGLEPSEVFQKANNGLCDNNKAGLFVTAWMGVLDIETGTMQYVNAGHNPPVAKFGGEPFEFIKSRPGLVLAGMEDMNYRQNEIQFNAGDRLFLYTDGVTEATSVKFELYGDNRLIRYLNANAEDEPESLLRGLRANMDEFVGEAEQFDDITMLVLDYLGNEE